MTERLAALLMFAVLGIGMSMIMIRLDSLDRKIVRPPPPRLTFCIYELEKDSRGVNFKIDTCGSQK